MAQFLSRFRLALLLLLAIAPQARAETPRVLIMATNVSTLPNGKESGTFLMEIALPYAVFAAAGFEIDVVTPKGGVTAMYDRPQPNPRVVAATESAGFKAKTTASLRPEEVKPERYAVVFYPGGHGQYFDLADSAPLHRLAVQIHERGGIIATAGHGAAMLTKLRTTAGQPFAAGKRLTCFPTWGELKFMNLSDFGKALAFDMEKDLQAQGAQLYVPAEIDGRETAIVVDEANRLYTGAWATNAENVAWLVVARLKR